MTAARAGGVEFALSHTFLLHWRARNFILASKYWQRLAIPRDWPQSHKTSPRSMSARPKLTKHIATLIGVSLVVGYFARYRATSQLGLGVLPGIDAEYMRSGLVPGSMLIFGWCLIEHRRRMRRWKLSIALQDRGDQVKLRWIGQHRMQLLAFLSLHALGPTVSSARSCLGCTPFSGEMVKC